MSKVNWPDYEAHLDNEPYEFYILGVWVDGEEFYLGTDSGCSCPTPWESYTEDDLTGPLTFEQMAEEANNLAAVSPNYDCAQESVGIMLKEVQDALHNRR